MNESIDDFELELKCKFYKYDNDADADNVDNNDDDNESDNDVNCNDFDQQDQDKYVEANTNAKTYTKKTDLNVKRRCRSTMNSMLNSNISSDNSSFFNVSNYAVSLLTEDVCFT